MEMKIIILTHKNDVLTKLKNTNMGIFMRNFFGLIVHNTRPPDPPDPCSPLAGRCSQSVPRKRTTHEQTQTVARILLVLSNIMHRSVNPLTSLSQPCNAPARLLLTTPP